MGPGEKIYVPATPYEAGPLHGVLSPFEPGTRTLPAGYQIDPQFKPIPCDIVFEKDVPVTMRDGVTIYVDIFRPVGSEKVPVLIAWSPYGKSGGTAPKVTMLYTMLGMDNAIVSGLAKFEAPDPAYWCVHGYAVCNPDPRGIAFCEGDAAMFGPQEGQDCHDLIEWLGVQGWCNGKVGMSGTSYLAISQWFTAAEQPPHLAAINPEEGLSDVYRDLVFRGGIPDFGFAERLRLNYTGAGQREDNSLEAQANPLVNALWDDKVAKFDRITVPAYVTASYSNTLHTMGTFRGWRRMASKEKWLRIHATQEWPDYYDEANTEDLRRFFDHFLKGADNGWEKTPRVRYAVHDMRGGDQENLPADSFPPEGVTNTKFFLHGGPRILAPIAPVPEIPAEYDSESNPALCSFTVRFDQETVLAGYPKAHLWVEARGSDDMDLFLLVQKLDAQGSHLSHITVPNSGARMQDITEQGSSVFRYKGSLGRLRVSARHLDPALSTDEVPAHSFDRVEKLSPGEVVDIEIDLSPMGMVFRPGEQLRLVIGARNITGPLVPLVTDLTPDNKGQHVIHTGGSRASYLQLPIMAG
ncbi:CocE/NonD family hydrolase [Sphingomonas sp. MG17]|uniref:CocE/NonD family hydrolase n=1 Tax=Sphingomonas tagetis TaxID=2949092 RepID=A0A9X2HP93_9SPHN|nr:CocE/NonD family hydrolase [Sphingomonas tagetis]MCP3730010.1 CocE/NonD family hydrolase [Sphingomonas tagetis]